MLLQYFENFVASKYICYSVITFLNTVLKKNMLYKRWHSVIYLQMLLLTRIIDKKTCLCEFYFLFWKI